MSAPVEKIQFLGAAIAFFRSVITGLPLVAFGVAGLDYFRIGAMQTAKADVRGERGGFP